MDNPSVEELPIEALIPYEFNNKVHGDEQVNRVANSISEFGYTYPILIDEHNVILAGHKRLLASKKLGLRSVPVLRKVGLTEAQKKAYRIIDNKSSEESEWHVGNLRLEFTTLEEIGFDLKPFIADDFRLKEESSTATEEGEPPAPRKTTIKVGDRIELGRHVVVCGDSTDSKTVASLSKDPVDLLVTDPPYNVAYEGKTEEALKIQNDKMNGEDFLAFLTKALSAAVAVLKPGGSFYIFHADSEGLRFRQAVLAAGLDLKQTVIWNKNTMVLGRQDYQWKHEPCLYGWKPGAAHYFVDDRTLTTVWDCDKPNASREHPTMKPVELMARCIQNSSLRGGVVLDPFLGSGTTLIAAEQLERRCVGLELDPKYCQVIVDRYQKLCVDNNRPFDCKINGEKYNG